MVISYRHPLTVRHRAGIIVAVSGCINAILIMVSALKITISAAKRKCRLTWLSLVVIMATAFGHVKEGRKASDISVSQAVAKRGLTENLKNISSKHNQKYSGWRSIFNKRHLLQISATKLSNR